MTPVLFCPDHGVCSLGKKKKACNLLLCHIYRSDLCQQRVSNGGWGYRQCSRNVGPQGYCKRHGKGATHDPRGLNKS
jgi:hypothetical protein